MPRLASFLLIALWGASAAAWPGADAYLAAEAEALVAAAEAGRADALPRLHRVANLMRLHPAPARWIGALDAVRRAPRAPPLARDHAAFLRAEAFAAAADFAARDRALDAVGLARRGWLAGPFANPAGSGHTTVYPPERGGARDAPMTSAGRRAGWRDGAGLAPDGRWRLSELLGSEGEGVGYLAVDLEVPRRTKAVLRIGATDAVTAWVDGQVVLREARDQFAALDQLAAPVTLTAGRHQLLVKVAWRDRDGALFVRWTRPDGGALPGLSWRDPDAIRPVAPGEPPAAAPGPLARLPDPARATPEELALRADLVAVLGLFDARARPAPPETLLARAVEARPDQTMWRFLLAHRTRARDPNAAAAGFAAVVEANPRHAPALVALAEQARDGGRLLDARDALDAAIEADPTFAAARTARAALGFERLEEGPLALARLLAPDRPPSVAVRWYAARLRRSLSDEAGARAELARVLEAEPTHAGALGLAADLALEAGDADAAARHLAVAARARPWRWRARRRWIRALFAADRGEAARRALAEARRRFAHAAPLHVLAADLALEAEDRSGALAALEAALAADPRATDVAARRAHLFGAQGTLRGRHRVPPGSLRHLPVDAAERAAGAAVLSLRDVVQLRTDGRSVRYVQRIWRVQRPGLAASHGRAAIPYVPSREQVTLLSADRIRPDGRRFGPSRVLDEGPDGKVGGMYVDQRAQIVAFDDLAPGDLVHLEYRVDPIGLEIFGGFFGHIFAAQDTLPIRHFEAWVYAPADRPLFTAQISAAAPEVEVQGAVRRYAWRLEDVPPLPIEPLGPPYPEIGRLLSVSSYPDWEALAAWYGPLYARQARLDDDARAAGRAAVGSAATDEEKVRRLYAHVVTHTRYVGIELGIYGWQPFSASEVHRRGYGDCKDKSTLLVALLADHGIEAHLTLVRTRDRGRLPLDHATMWAFNHAIVYVPELDLFLDPTAEFHGTRSLPALDQGAQALIVDAAGAHPRPVVLPFEGPAAHANHATYTATLAVDGRLALAGVERFTGEPAAELRRALEAPRGRRRYLEDHLGDDFPGAEVISATFSDLADREAEVRYRYRVSVPRYGRRDEGTSSLPVALFQHRVADAYAPLGARRTAVHLRHPWRTTNRVRYRLPPGAQVELPEPVSVASAYISLEQRIERTPTGFMVEDTLTVKTAVVPAEDYAAFRDACLAIDRALARRVVIAW